MEPISAGTVSKAQAQNNNGQASPAPFQNRASENEQDFYSSVRLISGDTDPVADNSQDRKNEVNHDQNTNTNLNFSGNSCDSRIDHNPGSSNRTDDEVKNDQALEGLTGSNLDNCRNNYLGQLSQINDSDSSDCFGLETPSARLSAPTNQASFDNVQPDTQKPKKRRRASGSTKTLTERKRNTLTPPTISGCKWKPSGKTGWELYTREASISENGKRSSKGKYLAYYSKEDIRRLNAKRTKKTKLRRDAKSS